MRSAIPFKTQVGLAVLLALALNSRVLAFQRANLDVSGTVKDPNGAVVKGAIVRFHSDSFAVSRRTGEDGTFVFDNVPVTSGAIQVRAQGFEPFEQPWRASSSVVKMELVLRPAVVMQQVTVSATRTPTPVLDSPGNVTVLSYQDLASAGAVTLDDMLRRVPGFSLFRRSGSRTANPTSQGVSLRGLGASGSSRALVLSDDTPLNDPFGGWVYWDRIPLAAIETVEVSAGGGSPLYGSNALGGVVDIIRRTAHHPALTLYSSYGNERTPDASLFGSETHGPWAAAIDAEVFHTDGYIPVPLDRRGAVDSFASSEYATGDLTIEHKLGDQGRAFLRGSSFGESRNNGTLLQNNRTNIRELQVGADWHSDALGSFSLGAYVQREVFHQTFSSISSDRNTETLTRRQRVPAQGHGTDIQWSRRLGRQTLVAGFEAHHFRGESDEIATASNTAVETGGRQRNYGVFGEAIFQITSRWLVTPAARVDNWTNFDAFSSTQSLPAGPVARTGLAERGETFFSPRLGMLYRVTNNVSLTASAYRSFRAPTLNELYRSFRLGNIETNANDQLLAERLTGGEGGVIVTGFHGRLRLRGDFFWADITRPIANVTLSTTPALIIRQRENLGRTRSRGIETTAEAHISSAFTLSGGFQFADATVLSFPGNNALVGLDIPQVPRHVVTVQARYFKPRWVTLGIQGRFVGVQYDDDLNTLPLRRFFTTDAMASHPLTRSLEVFVAADNLLNQRYDIARTPVLNVAPPILARAGLRLNLGTR